MKLQNKIISELSVLTAIPTIAIYISLHLDRNWTSLVSNLLLALWILLVLTRMMQTKVSLTQLGFNKNHLNGFKPHLIFTLGGLSFAFLLAFLMNRSISEDLFSYSHFQYGFLVTAFIQQLVFRGYFITRLESVFNKKQTALISSALFSLVHIPFEEAWLNIPLTFVGGYIWAKLFFKYRNIYLLVASHAVLNFVFVMFGFISNEGIKF